MARIKRGRVLFEINGVDAETAKTIFAKASHKLPLQTRTVARGEVN
jgi:large subunit ribosomal protein L16